MGSAHRGAEKPRKMKTFIVMMILSLGVIHCQRPGRRPTGQCEEGQTCQVLKNCQELADIYSDKKRKLEIVQFFNSRVCNRKERKVCCTAPQIGYSGNVTRNTTIGTLANWGPEYRVSVDIMVHSAGSTDVYGYSNILHFTAGADDWTSKLGERIPAIYYHRNPESVFHICSTVGTNGNSCFDYNIEFNKEYHIDIVQAKKNGKFYYTVNINGEEIKNVENTNPQSFEDVKVFGGNNFNPASDASYKNLIWESKASNSTTAEQVTELPLESIFGPGHAGVIQRTAFRPSLNQTQITVPAHGDGAFLALDVVIQGLGGEDQVTDPYLLTVKEEKCFMNNLPNDLDPAEASYENTGKIAKKHLIQTNITRIQKATADYEELPGRVRNKCEGKEIFKGGYKFLSQEQYEESMETENFIGHSQSSTNLIRTKRGGPQCMREYKCTYDGGRGCFCFGSTHIYDGQREKCVCCKRNCPQSTIGNDCKCGDLRAETFLNCNNSQDYDGFPYPTEDTCTSPTNGGWGSWTSWSECSSGSNPTKRRSRQCNDPEPANEGNDCSGDSEETKNCPVDGGWGSWTSWSSCCTKRRSRNCDNPAPSNGGVNCSGDQDETVVEDCRPVDGGWGSWASWSSCFIGPNGYQIRERNRLCDNPAPSNGGVNCPGNSEETENCSGPKVQPCFVSGGPAAGEP